MPSSQSDLNCSLKPPNEIESVALLADAVSTVTPGAEQREIDELAAAHRQRVHLLRRIVVSSDFCVVSTRRCFARDGDRFLDRGHAQLEVEGEVGAKAQRRGPVRSSARSQRVRP